MRDALLDNQLITQENKNSTAAGQAEGLRVPSPTLPCTCQPLLTKTKTKRHSGKTLTKTHINIKIGMHANPKRTVETQKREMQSVNIGRSQFSIVLQLGNIGDRESSPRLAEDKLDKLVELVRKRPSTKISGLGLLKYCENRMTGREEKKTTRSAQIK